MAIRNGPLWDKVIKGAVCLGLFLAFWSVQWVIPDFYQELFRLSLAGDVDVLIDYISSFGIYAALISIFMITVTDMTGIDLLNDLVDQLWSNLICHDCLHFYFR